MAEQGALVGKQHLSSSTELGCLKAVCCTLGAIPWGSDHCLTDTDLCMAQQLPALYYTCNTCKQGEMNVLASFADEKNTCIMQYEVLPLWHLSPPEPPPLAHHNPLPYIVPVAAVLDSSFHSTVERNQANIPLLYPEMFQKF